MNYPELSPLLAFDKEMRDLSTEIDDLEYRLAMTRMSQHPTLENRSADIAAYHDRLLTAIQRRDYLRSNELRLTRATYSYVTRTFSPDPDINTIVGSDMPGVFGLYGLAAIFNQPFQYNDGRTTKTVIVDEGAFKNLDTVNVVLRLGGHTEAHPVIASTEKGTLRLKVTSEGLRFVAAAPFDESVIAACRSMSDCSWQGNIDTYTDNNGIEHWRSIDLDGGDVCLCPKGQNHMTAFGGSEEELHNSRMSKLDAELAAHGIY
jgi:hypothetical protein